MTNLRIVTASLCLLLSCAASDTILGQADNISIKSGAGLFGVKNEVLQDSLIVTAFSSGVPTIGDTILFAFGSVPSGATGHSLSDSLVVTDANGTAGVLLTLGNKNGFYEITANAADSAGSVFHIDVRTLKQTIFDLQNEIKEITRENDNLIIAHEEGFSHSIISASGVTIDLSIVPNTSTKTLIRQAFNGNMDIIVAKAQRIKSLVP